jgi:hypothetical protein
MKKNEDLQKEVQDAIKREPLLNTTANDVNAKFSKHLKKVIYVTSLVGIGLLFNSCMAGYVASEPSYVEFSRPPRPDNLSIWIDGDWGWNSQSQVYVQKTGYWAHPKQGKTFVSGHWQASKKGKSWVAGRWVKQGGKVNNSWR